MAETLNVFKSCEYQAEPAGPERHQSIEHPVSVMSSLMPPPPSAPQLHYVAVMGRLPGPKLKEEELSP